MAVVWFQTHLFSVLCKSSKEEIIAINLLVSTVVCFERRLLTSCPHLRKAFIRNDWWFLILETCTINIFHWCIICLISWSENKWQQGVHRWQSPFTVLWTTCTHPHLKISHIPIFTFCLWNYNCVARFTKQFLPKIAPKGETKRKLHH